MQPSVGCVAPCFSQMSKAFLPGKLANAVTWTRRKRGVGGSVAVCSCVCVYDMGCVCQYSEERVARHLASLRCHWRFFPGNLAWACWPFRLYLALVSCGASSRRLPRFQKVLGNHWECLIPSTTPAQTFYLCSLTDICSISPFTTFLPPTLSMC
jgi:hypothetical protein